MYKMKLRNFSIESLPRAFCTYEMQYLRTLRKYEGQYFCYHKAHFKSFNFLKNRKCALQCDVPMYESVCLSHLEPILCGKRCYYLIACYSLTISAVRVLIMISHLTSFIIRCALWPEKYGS